MNKPQCIIIFLLTGEMWKTEIELITRQNSHLARIDLAKLVFDSLQQMFNNVNWFVIIYDDVTGSQYHYVIGYDYYALFRHYGNNIVVLRLVFPCNRDQASDLEGKFLRAYEPHFDGKHIHAENTGHSTWNNLPSQGVAPWNLFTLRSGIEYGYWAHITGRIYENELPSGQGFSAVIGEKY